MKVLNLIHRLLLLGAIPGCLVMPLAANAEFVALLEVIETPTEPLVSEQTAAQVAGKVAQLRAKSPKTAFESWLRDRAFEVQRECRDHASIGGSSDSPLQAISVYAGVKTEKIARQCELLATEGFSPVCEVTAVPALLKNSKKVGIPYSYMTSLYRPLSEISRPTTLERVAVFDCYLHRSKLIAHPASFKTTMVIEPFQPRLLKIRNAEKNILSSKVLFTSKDVPGHGPNGQLADVRPILLVDPPEQDSFSKN